MSKHSKLFYQILAGLLIMNALQHVMDISFIIMILRESKDLMNLIIDEPSYYIAYLDIILVLFLEILLIFGLLKFKKWAPAITVILFIWMLGYYIYHHFLLLPQFFVTEFDLIGLGALVIIGGGIVAKILKDRKEFQA